MIDDLLQQEIQANMRDQSAGVLYFNDLDSFSLGCAAGRLGKQVILHVFTLNGAPSRYVESSRETARVMRWQVEVHDINTSIFFEQIRELLSSLNLHRKKDVAMFYVASELMQKIGEDITLCSFGLDTLFGLTSSFKRIHRSNAQAFFSLRQTFLERSGMPENCVALQPNASTKLFAPYAQSQVVIKNLLARNWRELNVNDSDSRVQLKIAIRREFDREIACIGRIDTHSRAFKSSGLDLLINEIPKNRSINFQMRRSLVEILVDWRLRRSGR